MRAILAILMMLAAVAFYGYFYNQLTKHDAVATPVAVSTPEPRGTPYVNRLALVNGKYVDAVPDSTPSPTATPVATPSPTVTPLPKAVVKTMAPKSAEVAIVDNESDADATHIYFGAVDAEFTKLDYKGNPKAFVQGWKDGWKWASKRSDFSSDQPAEDRERQLYGDIDNDPGETKAIAFFDAFSVLRHRAASPNMQSTQGFDGTGPVFAGPPPEVDGLWGVHLSVHEAIKSVLSDPESYKYISVSGPWHATHDGKDCWIEKVHFRAKNGFGGYVVDTASVWVVVGQKGGSETVLDVKLSSQE
jgi:hypothetical protein